MPLMSLGFRAQLDELFMAKFNTKNLHGWAIIKETNFEIPPFRQFLNFFLSNCQCFLFYWPQSTWCKKGVTPGRKPSQQLLKTTTKSVDINYFLYKSESIRFRVHLTSYTSKIPLTSNTSPSLWLFIGELNTRHTWTWYCPTSCSSPPLKLLDVYSKRTTIPDIILGKIFWHKNPLPQILCWLICKKVIQKYVIRHTFFLRAARHACYSSRSIPRCRLNHWEQWHKSLKATLLCLRGSRRGKGVVESGEDFSFALDELDI